VEDEPGEHHGRDRVERGEDGDDAQVAMSRRHGEEHVRADVAEAYGDEGRQERPRWREARADRERSDEGEQERDATRRRDRERDALVRRSVGEDEVEAEPDCSE
jgi:hypothetical protein